MVGSLFSLTIGCLLVGHTIILDGSSGVLIDDIIIIPRGHSSFKASHPQMTSCKHVAFMHDTQTLELELCLADTLKRAAYTDSGFIPRVDPDTGLPLLCETTILRDTESLSQSSSTGNVSETRYLYRIIGTREHAEAEEWMLGRLYELKAECDRLAETRGGLECEVMRQVGSGSHR